MTDQSLKEKYAIQLAVVRYAHTKFLIAAVGRYAAGLVLIIGLATIPNGTGIIISIVGILSIMFAHFNFKDAQKELQQEEKALIDLLRT